MTISEWIKEQIDALRAMMIADDPADDIDPPDATTVISGDGISEIRRADKLSCRFFSSPAHLSRVRKSIEHFCSEAGLDRPACDEVGLVVNEALANVIRHAYSGAKDQPIEIETQRLDPGIKISIRDWGNGITPPSHPPQMKDPLVPGGLGLICMRQLMDNMEFITQRDGMLLVMTRTAPGSKAANVVCDA